MVTDCQVLLTGSQRVRLPISVVVEGECVTSDKRGLPSRRVLELSIFCSTFILSVIHFLIFSPLSSSSCFVIQVVPFSPFPVKARSIGFTRLSSDFPRDNSSRETTIPCIRVLEVILCTSWVLGTLLLLGHFFSQSNRMMTMMKILCSHQMRFFFFRHLFLLVDRSSFLQFFPLNCIVSWNWMCVLGAKSKDWRGERVREMREKKTESGRKEGKRVRKPFFERF